MPVSDDCYWDIYDEYADGLRHCYMCTEPCEYVQFAITITNRLNS